MLRIGILGMGGMGWFHASRYFQIPNVKLAAIADIRPERLEARHAVKINIENEMADPNLDGIDRFLGGDQLISSADVDMIDICLPSFLHAEFTVKALRAGRHVLCEKPMALTVKDADRMIAASHQMGKKLMIAQCIRFWPEYRFLKQLMLSGQYGRLLSLNLGRIGGRPVNWGWENWFLDPARSGGSLYDLHIHDVDFVNSLLGTPDTVQATGRRITAESACEVIHSLFGYANGAQVSIHAGWSEVQIPFKAWYEAWFEKGFVRLDPDKNPSIQIFDHVETIQEKPAEYTRGDAYLNEIQYFINCIEQDKEPLECPPESARDSLLLLEKIRASIL
jgi:predicted dehydrogenase